MDTRTRVLEAAEYLLRTSPDRDVSTRAVCDAVGVGAPVLYRLFGDKNGMLAAVVDNAFDRYLTMKRASPLSDDPVDDLYVAWDDHVAFASKHPAVYRHRVRAVPSRGARRRRGGPTVAHRAARPVCGTRQAEHHSRPRRAGHDGRLRWRQSVGAVATGDLR